MRQVVRIQKDIVERASSLSDVTEEVDARFGLNPGSP
jgi:hypothetical protein